MISRWTYAAACFGMVSCGGGPATFHVEHAKGATVAPTAIAVLGVYKDGRLSPEAWEELGPKLSRPFGGEPCEVGFGDKLRAADSDRFTKVEEEAMSQGMTDELLEPFGAATDGDAILVFHMFRSVPGKSELLRAPPPSSRNMGGGMMRRGGGMPYSSSGSSSTTMKDPDLALELAASIYSVREKRTILEISMKYHGASRDEAIELFVQKLGSELPRVTCKGWSFSRQ